LADDEKTPESETPPANPPADTPPVSPPADAPKPPAAPEPPKEGEDLRDVVRGLTETVAGLVTSVTALTESSRRDVAPTKRPWTHYGSRQQP
jgi:hypothetical protein